MFELKKSNDIIINFIHVYINVGLFLQNINMWVNICMKVQCTLKVLDLRIRIGL